MPYLRLENRSNMVEEVDWSKMGSMERRMLYKVMMMAGCSPRDVSAARATAAGRRADGKKEMRRFDVPQQTLGGWAGGFSSGIAKTISPPPNWRGRGLPTSFSSPLERARRREDLLKELQERNEQRLRSLHFSNVDSPLTPPDTEWKPLTSTPSTATAGGKRLRVPACLTQMQMNSIRKQNKERLAAAHAESHAIVTSESVYRKLELHARSLTQAITGPVCVCV
jgi:flavin-binding protein dodecin